MIKSGDVVRVKDPIDSATLKCASECDQYERCFVYGKCTMKVKEVSDNEIIFDVTFDDIKCKYLPMNDQKRSDNFSLMKSWEERIEVVE